MLTMRIVALARQRGLTVTRPTRKASLTLYVQSTDDAALDAFEPRLDEHIAKLDIEALAVNGASMHTNTSVSLPSPRTP